MCLKYVIYEATAQALITHQYHHLFYILKIQLDSIHLIFLQSIYGWKNLYKCET